MTLGDKVKKLRGKKHMSQQKLADIMGINQTFISAIELGAKKPSFDVLQKLADALGIPVSELVDKDERQESFAMSIIKRLVDEGIIKDGEVSDEDMNAIIYAIKIDIKRIEKEKGSI